MRVLSVSAQKPDSTGSGVYLAQTVRSFSRMGFEQSVIAGIAPDDAPSFPDGVRFRPVVYETESLPFPVCGMSDSMPYPSTRYRDMTPTMVAQFVRAFEEAVRDEVAALRPDVIVCHHLYLAASVVRDACPDAFVACVCHSTDLRQMANHGLERHRILDAMRRVDLVFALHDDQASQIAEAYGIDPARIVVVGTGFDDGVFNPGDGAPVSFVADGGEGARPESHDADGIAFEGGRESSSGSRTWNLAYVGKIWGKKGVPSLIRALDALDVPAGTVCLRLIGGHSTPEEYEGIVALAEGSSQDVRFLGKVSQEELVEAYRSSDLFVLPSFFEGLPLVVIEALACGAPVVMTDLPGIRQWIEANAPGAPVTFVALPRMEGVDTPCAEDLPGFEERLARAIEDALRAGRRPADVSALTWDAVCARMAGALRRAGVPGDSR